jgi:hypothetical protein
VKPYYLTEDEAAICRVVFKREASRVAVLGYEEIARDYRYLAVLMTADGQQQRQRKVGKKVKP